MKTMIQNRDEKILLSLQHHRSVILTKVLVFFTWTGRGRVWVTVAVGLNLLNHFRPFLPKILLDAFYAPLLVWAINRALKSLFQRRRPATANSAIVPLDHQPGLDSFPSSHSGSTFSFFFILTWWHFPGAWWFGVWALIVSFSRMYLGVHFLTDVIGGILVGLGSAMVINQIFL